MKFYILPKPKNSKDLLCFWRGICKVLLKRLGKVPVKIE